MCIEFQYLQTKSLLLKLLIFPSFIFLFNPIWLSLSLSLSTIQPLLFFPSLLSLGAGWWILNPCGLLGGGLFFQIIAWQNLKHHHHHHQSQNLSQNHPLFFTSSHFSSSSSFSSTYPTNHTLLPWPLQKKTPNHQNQPCPPQACTLRTPKNPILHLLLRMLEENLVLMLMKFQVVQTLYQIKR